MSSRKEGGHSASVTSFNMIELFAGIGGLTVGFRDASREPRARFIPRLMVDVDRDARDVAMRNFPDVPYLLSDVHRLSDADVRNHARLEAREPIHVLIGGPPCQGFSWLGRRALDDARNVHLLDFLRMVKELRPVVALIEKTCR